MASIKKVLMAAINADHPQTGMLYAFNKIFGAENVRNFDYLAMRRSGVDPVRINEAFIEAVRSFRPDWVWLQVQDTGILSSYGVEKAKAAVPTCVISHWTGDLRPSVSEYLASFCKASDITFASSEGQLPLFRAAGARRAEYCQIGLDYEEDVLKLPHWTPPFRISEVLFIGNFYGTTFPGTKDRCDGINALKNAGIDIGIVGSGWPQGYPVLGQCGVKQQSHCWARTKVCVNINNVNTVNRYWSDRQIISIASGNPLVCFGVPDLGKDFVDGVHCLSYRDTGTLVAHVRKLLGDAGLRARIGSTGKAEVLKSHTWESRFRQIIPVVEAAARR